VNFGNRLRFPPAPPGCIARASISPNLPVQQGLMAIASACPIGHPADRLLGLSSGCRRGQSHWIHFMSALLRLGAMLMRRVPGSKALRISRHWRDLARLPECDIVLVSFPKSGRTFVRAMLARLYQTEFGLDERDLLDFQSLRRAPKEIPHMLFTHDGDAMRRPSKIKINKRAYRGSKVALLARHPGDVVVSRYYHLKHRSQDATRKRLAQQPLEEFVWTEHGGVPSIVNFLNGWAEFASERGDITIFRYEDFLENPEPTLQALAALVGLNSAHTAIHDAVEFTRFENLKKKEAEGYYASDRLQPRSPGIESSFKVRSGKAGGFRNTLSDETVARIDAYVTRHLSPVFGYFERE
jgi:hypothetical protein